MMKALAVLALLSISADKPHLPPVLCAADLPSTATGFDYADFEYRAGYDVTPTRRRRSTSSWAGTSRSTARTPSGRRCSRAPRPAPKSP